MAWKEQSIRYILHFIYQIMYIEGVSNQQNHPQLTYQHLHTTDGVTGVSDHGHTHVDGIGHIENIIVLNVTEILK